MEETLFASRVLWAGLIASLLMICSGGWLLSVPSYVGEGLFIMSFGAMTMALVLMTNVAISRFQKRAIDYSRDVNATLILLEHKSDEVSKPQTVEEKSFEEFEVSEQSPFKEKEKTPEEEISA